MLEKEFHISRLIAKHFRGQLSANDEHNLNLWLDSAQANRDYFDRLNDEKNIHNELKDYERIKKNSKEDVWKMTLSKLGSSFETTRHSSKPKAALKLLSYQWIAAAASIILILGTITYFVMERYPVVNQQLTVQNDIPGGTSKAYITLANGKTIQLSGSKTGIIISASKLIYNDGTVISTEHSASNMITTPRGGQYQIILGDGTTVYLNAASSLEYPATFEGANRTVKLTGEAYFEVAKDKNHPFVVETKGQQVQVLGTHFNINSYDDEPVTTTTLLEGSVKVGALQNKELILSPGQQSTLSATGNFTVAKVDVQEAVAWKNGDFIFNGDDLESVMRQLSRWYNVDVTYQGNISDIGFVSTISRSKSLSGVIKALETTEGVHFKIEGRRILVMP